MTMRNHALDSRIAEAAREEFMEYGFRKASVHRIAARAGLTTGAIYTRYEGKDDLFCSLSRQAFQKILEQAPSLTTGYNQALGDGQAVLQAIRQEEQFYLQLLYDHYEDCVLFICRSDGSSVEKQITHMMEQKASQTVQYLQSMAKRPLNTDSVQMIMEEQFGFFRRLLEKGYDRERATACMKTVEDFMESGWRAILDGIL